MVAVRLQLFPAQVNLNGQVMQVTCPPNAQAGMPIMINVPHAPMPAANAGRAMYQQAMQPQMVVQQRPMMQQHVMMQPGMMMQPGVVMAPQPVMMGGGMGMGYGYGGKKARKMQKKMYKRGGMGYGPP